MTRVVFFSSVALLVFVCGLSGCAVSPDGMSYSVGPKYIEKSDREEIAPIKKEVSDENIAVVLDTVLLPDGPGAWIKDAKWDEYILTIHNKTNSIVTIQDLSIVDARGTLVSQPYNLHLLEQKTKALKGEYESAGLAVGKNIGWQAGAMGAGALALLMGPAVGVAAAGAGLYSVYAGRQDEEKTTNEYQLRKLTKDSKIDQHGRLTKSAFFPLMPPPETLVVQYQYGDESSNTLRMGLKDLFTQEAKQAQVEK